MTFKKKIIKLFTDFLFSWLVFRFANFSHLPMHRFICKTEMFLLDVLYFFLQMTCDYFTFTSVNCKLQAIKPHNNTFPFLARSNNKMRIADRILFIYFCLRVLLKHNVHVTLVKRTQGNKNTYTQYFTG